MTHYVETKSLPPVMIAALREAGFKHATIGVGVSETASVCSPAGYDGTRGFTALIDLDAGRYEIHRGDWGGPNPFHAAPIDHDDRPRPLAPGQAVINGWSGRSSHATVTVHPAQASRLLPVASGDGPTERERRLLGVYRMLNSRGRADWFDRHPNERPTDNELSTLAEQGFLKVSKAGVVTITAAGKNAANDKGIY